MKAKQLLMVLSVTNILFFNSVFSINAQNTESVINNNPENVNIDLQESGSQSQGQSANGNTSDVNVVDNERSDNFWSNSYRGRINIPPGSASLTCGEQHISYSRSAGGGLVQMSTAYPFFSRLRRRVVTPMKSGPVSTILSLLVSRCWRRTGVLSIGFPFFGLGL